MIGVRPLALVDVDGVLNPYAAPICPPGYAEHELFPGEHVRVNPAHGPLLERLTVWFDLVWATSWNDDANRLLAPRLGLPDLPVIAFPDHDGGHEDKFAVIAAAVGDRSCVWFDDLHSAASREWEARRPTPTLLIHVDPVHGLGEQHVAQAVAFGQRQLTTPGPPPGRSQAAARRR